MEQFHLPFRREERGIRGSGAGLDSGHLAVSPTATPAPALDSPVSWNMVLTVSGQQTLCLPRQDLILHSGRPLPGAGSRP